jgi:hypothetical protein
MKVPTTATNVFNPLTWTGNGTSGRNVQPGNLTDIYIGRARGDGSSWLWFDRLRGALQRLSSDQTAAESTFADSLTSFAAMNGAIFGGTSGPNFLNNNNISYWMRRAPGFFDEVCYTGTGTNTTVAHNLGVVPELMIVKGRANAQNWVVYSTATGAGNILVLNTTAATTANAILWIANPTASVFSVGTSSNANGAGLTYVNYLFASCPGVSKVGSFTGTGATQVINCGFTGGARFVLIKATSTTGSWYVWDSARGIVAGNDPYLLLNSTAAEVTNTDWVDTAATGFELSNAGGNLANSNGVTYIFLAIA